MPTRTSLPPFWLFTFGRAKKIVIVFLTVVLGVIGLSFTSTTYAAPQNHESVTSYSAPKAPPGAYNIRKTYTSRSFGRVNLREGYYDRAKDQGFGYQKIVQKHPPFNDAAIRYTLEYGQVTNVSGTSQTVVGIYPGDNSRWTVTFDQRVLGDGTTFGIVTAFRPDGKSP